MTVVRMHDAKTELDLMVAEEVRKLASITLEPIETEDERKLKATRKAEFALAGFELVELPDGTFVAARWGMSSAPLMNLAEIDAFAKRAGIRIEEV